MPTHDERKVDGSKTNVVFYKMVLGFQKNNKRWVLEKRYSEFDALDKVLRESYSSLPSLPGKTLFKLSDLKQIESRKKTLNEYMKALINRRDLRTCTFFRKFIDLDNQFPQSQAFEATKIGFMACFGKGVRDMVYLPKYEAAFVALSDMNLASRLDSYFTNVSIFVP